MLTLVIQAGGESRRMGRDKALLPFLGAADDPAAAQSPGEDR